MNFKLESAHAIKEEYMETDDEKDMPGTSGLGRKQINNEHLDNSVVFLLDSDVLAYILDFQKESIKNIE